MLSHLNYLNIFSIAPPIVAILLALKFKDVISSLLIGILCGAFIYSNGNCIKTVEITFSIMISKIGDNAGILAFLGILGILVTVISLSGGSYAYGEWVSTKIKTKHNAQIATAIFGMLIFIDDYFNCLTVGTVMKTITDRYNISRAKLAYIIDSTAAPICIIAPISSWGASIASTMESSGINNGINMLFSTIPLNLYSILTIIMVFIVCSTNLSFGAMKKHDFNNKNNYINSQQQIKESYIDDIKISKFGKTYDLLIPIITLIISSILFMIYTGFNNCNLAGVSINIIDVFGWASTITSLILGGFTALLISFILYIPRKIISVHDFTASFTIGVKSMVPSFLILIMSWTIGEICGSTYLNTGGVISSVLNNNLLFPIYFLPVLFFIISGVLSFSTGTSWGTIALILPIGFSICSNMNSLFLISVFSSTLAGSVFGDHISPISDTTILSSTGSGCDHIVHISTQMPYAFVVAFCSIIGYIVMGISCAFTDSYLYTFLCSFLSSLFLLFILLYQLNKK